MGSIGVQPVNRITAPATIARLYHSVALLLGEHVQQRAANIERAASVRKHPRRDDVHKQSDEGDPQHHAARDGLGHKQPAHRFDGDEHDEHEQRQRVHEGRQDFGAGVSVRRPA